MTTEGKNYACAKCSDTGWLPKPDSTGLLVECTCPMGISKSTVTLLGSEVHVPFITSAQHKYNREVADDLVHGARCVDADVDVDIRVHVEIAEQHLEEIHRILKRRQHEREQRSATRAELSEG